MRIIKFDEDPKYNEEILSLVNTFMEKNGLEKSIEKIKILLSETENSKKILISNKSQLFNIEEQIELCKNILEYLYEIKMETRDKKLLSLLGENKHILNFKNFNLINEYASI
jgi:hypothetical protein